MMYKYVLYYDGGFLRDSADNGYVFDTKEDAIEEVQDAMDEYMDDWEVEGSEYESELFEYEIEEV